MPRISIAIPTYSANGTGALMLEESFIKIKEQSFKDFNVIVSDNSESSYSDIRLVCNKWQSKLSIKYYEHTGRKDSPSENTNNAIKMSDGELIKILCGDDLLYDKNSLQIIVDNFDDNTNWLFTSYVHSKNKIEYYRYYTPYMNDNIFIVNTLGTPSALTIRNKRDIIDINNLFDRNLRFCYDCEGYYRLYKVYGNPKVINDIGMINYVHDNSVTSHTTEEMIRMEEDYILKNMDLLDE
jgi:hypothetical protein